MRVFVNCINGNRLRFPHRKLVVVSFVTSAKWVFAHNDCIIAGTRPPDWPGPSEIAENSTFRASHTSYYARSSRYLECICTCARILHRVHMRSVLYKRHFLRIDKAQLKSLSKFLHCFCVALFRMRFFYCLSFLLLCNNLFILLNNISHAEQNAKIKKLKIKNMIPEGKN